MARGSVWIKILNCAVQLGPYGFQYVSMWMLIDLLVEYACEDSGWFFAFDDDPTCSANQCVGPSVRENIPRGTFECSRMGVPPVGIALLFVAVLLPLIVYQVWAVFRQVRHSTFGTLDYMCYLEVAKEKGSWFYHGLKVQVGLIILISLTVLIVAIIVLADKKANWKMYIKLLVKVGIRAAVGLFKIPHMLAYDGPVNGKAHARLCRYAMPGYSIKYSWMQDSQSLMTKITCILSIDPIVAEKILIESTHMQQGNKQTGIQALLPGRAPEEGTPEDRERDMETLLDDGVKVSQLKRATIGEGRGNLLGGGMGHVDASLMASIGQANDLWPEQVGKCGEDTREMVPWAETYRGPRRNSRRCPLQTVGDGGETLPLDSHPRARAAQMRFRELEWFFGDPHARQGLESGKFKYEGPPTAAAAAGDANEPAATPTELLRHEPPPSKQQQPAAGSHRTASAHSGPRPPTAAAAAAASSPCGSSPQQQGGVMSPGGEKMRPAMILWADGRRYPGYVATGAAYPGPGVTVYWEDGSRCDNIPEQHCQYDS
eukprot:TRINITY_DN3118_c2_g1_i5.p1 TRINITY_DN3118_c2_g1~~TRINITY_DN3118_c2_g1_i5.p1  ORF type:complete len:578 (+),score=167.07 TRINITY_DN3118_c2_g1_i5:106-1734(+)